MSSHRVFISYTTPDKTVAGLVCQALEQRHIECWIAPRNVPPGDNAFSSIPLGIEQCQVLVLILSSRTSQSKHVSREVQLALDCNKVIIPFRTEDIQPEQALAYILTGVQWLDAFVGPIERHVATLVERVEAILNIAPEQSSATRPTVISPVSRAAKPRSYWPVWLVTGAIVVGGALAAYMLPKRAPDDNTLHNAIVARLQPVLLPRNIALDCQACNQQQPHVDVQVANGQVVLRGVAASPDIPIIQSVPLDVTGIRSITYAVNPIATAAAAPRQPPPVTPVQNHATTQVPPPIQQSPNVAPAPPAPALTPEQLRAHAFVLTGQAKMNASDYISAESNFQAALSLDPGNAEAKRGLAAAKKELGD